MSSSTKLDPKTLVRELGMQPHPEGGYYKETFRDEQHSLDGRPASTLIYFLIESGNFSHLHRMDVAESWHFYAGDAIEVVELDEAGPVVTRLGIDFSKGEVPQYVVKGGRWFGSKPATGSSWALVGCAVAPAFLWDKFEIGKRSQLLTQFPSCKSWITALTSDD